MENLNKFGDKLLEYLNSAEIFLKANVPDFVQQFITYESWKAEMWYKFMFILLIILIVIQVINMIFTAFDKYSDSNAPTIILCTGIVGTIVVFMTISAYFDIKKLEMAPKVFMIERARDLITKK